MTKQFIQFHLLFSQLLGPCGSWKSQASRRKAPKLRSMAWWQSKLEKSWQWKRCILQDWTTKRLSLRLSNDSGGFWLNFACPSLLLSCLMGFMIVHQMKMFVRFNILCMRAWFHFLGARIPNTFQRKLSCTTTLVPGWPMLNATFRIMVDSLTVMDCGNHSCHSISSVETIFAKFRQWKLVGPTECEQSVPYHLTRIADIAWYSGHVFSGRIETKFTTFVWDATVGVKHMDAGLTYP